MKRKIIIFGSIFAVCILVMTGFSTTAIAETNENNNNNKEKNNYPPLLYEYIKSRKENMEARLNFWTYHAGITYYISHYPPPPTIDHPLCLIPMVLITIQRNIFLIIWSEVWLEMGWDDPDDILFKSSFWR